MKTITTSHTFEHTIKKPKFIGLIFPCSDKDHFEKHLAKVSSDYADSRHIAYAYKVMDKGQVFGRFFDAGEPSGTAGKPIYSHIEGKDLINVCLFVVRYFGGVKLGAGGLVRAYGGTARSVLEQATFIPFHVMASLKITIPYEQLRHLAYHLPSFQAFVEKKEFSGELTLWIKVPVHLKKELLDWFRDEGASGRLNVAGV